jgi:predicted TIM-barrel enzyme
MYLLSQHLLEFVESECQVVGVMTVKQIAGSPKYYDLNLNTFVEKAQNHTWTWMREHWQSLLSRNHIEFHFSYRNAL